LQTEDFKERILIPREEEKLRKKSELLDRFSGPAWKGKGYATGVRQQSDRGFTIVNFNRM